MSDVAYAAFSHMHFDHTGNANLFTESTWILNKAELAWALGAPTPLAVQPDSLSGSQSAKTRMIDGDLDVFGDGTVRILRMPGHTPGHQVLVLRLKRSGFVVLSGDLYHLRENRTHRRVPTFNVERADTLASMDRIERIVKNTKAHGRAARPAGFPGATEIPRVSRLAGPRAASPDGTAQSSGSTFTNFQGGMPAPRLAGLSYEYLVTAMRSFGKDERTNNLDMPGFMRALPERERNAIARYLSAL